MWLKIYAFVSQNLWLFGVAFFIWVSLRGMGKRDKHQAQAAKEWKDAVEKKLNEPLSLHPEIDPSLCAGCGACVRACPEGEIIKLINHKAVLVEPTKCVGHGECEAVCPFDAISLAFGTKTRGMDLPRVDGNYQTNVNGLYIAGELGGMGLIRNASKQGKLATEHAVKTLKPGVNADYDIVIVGAGPAGLSASLAAASSGKNYICLEQNKFGGTIYNFPRQKVVMSHPMELPVFGKITFPQHKVSKEQILALWNQIRKRANLNIVEEAKFITLQQQGQIFRIKTNKGELTAQKVILSMGVRGSPRKLNLPNEDSTKVTYNLIDPEQYQQKHVAIVGGGNAAAEAAQYLSRPQYRNQVFLLIRGPSFDRCNQENQDLCFEQEKRGLLKICYNSSVKEIHPDYLVIDRNKKTEKLKNDFLFIFAGAELPFEFLRGLGIMIDKKFGEAVKKAK